MPLTQTPEWQALKQHALEMKEKRIATLLDDPNRQERLIHRIEGIYLDFSHHQVTVKTLELLQDLAKRQNTMLWFERMCKGEPVNVTEGRPAHHTLLRDPAAPDYVRDVLGRMKALAEHLVRENVQDLVHIGIGGSDLGPRMLCRALERNLAPKVHFVSNIDPMDLERTLKNLNPKTTWISVASKTFTTLETIENLKSALSWLGAEHANQVIALTANTEEAARYNIKNEHILPMWDWVGGRFSLWSSVGFPIVVAAGYQSFIQLLDGAHAADLHAQTAPLEKNIPLTMALLSIWYRNFMGCQAFAVLPYAQELERFPAYVQQLEMESNGKSLTRDNEPCSYPTAPITFGDVGTNAQHAFFQMLHQGLDVIPCDFIGAINTNALHPQAIKEHKILQANLLAQSFALMQGVDDPQNPVKSCPGNRPSTMIMLPRVNAYCLGFLLALYEHKTVMQGFTWGINPFDQFGVELGKRLAKDLLASPAEVKHNLYDVHATRKLYFHLFGTE